MRKRLILTAALAAVLSVGTAARAADAVMGGVKGRVLVKTGNAESFYPARRGAPLFFGDQIKTEAGALAHVLFKDGATLLVKEKSDFTLEGNKRDTTVSFRVGEFLIGLKRKLRPDEKFRVRTPAAAAAVRGTLFWGLSDANQDSHYACFVDAIEITAQGKSLLLEKGQKVKIPYGHIADPPETADVPLDYMDTFAVDGALHGLKDMVAEDKKP
jgi:hypothetical protein